MMNLLARRVNGSNLIFMCRIGGLDPATYRGAIQSAPRGNQTTMGGRAK
jgi:hypothetical protein